eukprot:753179-Hanusia_phi.AAC.4
MEACLNSTEFCVDFATEFDNPSTVCERRNASFRVVKLEVNIPMRPSGIRFSQQPVVERAGVNFHEPVSCEMYDEDGNVLNTNAYRVELVVASASGSGCYLDRTAQSYPPPGIQMVVPDAGGSIRIVSPETLQTSNGVVIWENLICNVASNGCSECEANSCNEQNSYSIQCRATGDYCYPCVSEAKFHVLPDATSAIVGNKMEVVVAGSPRYVRPYSERLVDVYGNLVVCGNPGLVTVRVEQFKDPYISSLDFCTSEISLNGSVCLDGQTAQTVVAGKSTFGGLFMRYPGKNFMLRFQYQDMTYVTEPFDVLPQSPQVLGVTLSKYLTELVVHFDSTTNMDNMGASTDCNRVLPVPMLSVLGIGPLCTWLSPSTMQVELGLNATVLPGDLLSIYEASAQRSLLWFPVVQANGMLYLQQITSVDEVVPVRNVSLVTSLRSTEVVCHQVTRPMALEQTAQLEVAEDISVTDVERITIESEEYYFVSFYCKGQDCPFDIRIAATTAVFALNSTLYKVSPQGSFVPYQFIETFGATDVEPFYKLDEDMNGGIQYKQFVAICNYMGNSMMQTGFVSIFVWENNGFELRQTMPCNRCTSSSYAAHNGEHYLAFTNTGPDGYVAIFRWVLGSFRVIQDSKTSGMITWVGGRFEEAIQNIPTEDGAFCKLYHIPSQPALYLGIADRKQHGQFRSLVSIYRWQETICDVARNISCFQPFLQLPALGPQSFTPFSMNSRDYIAIANQFEGMEGNEHSEQYEKDSYIYQVDYDLKTISFVQAIPTAGAYLFDFLTVTQDSSDSHFLTVANLRGFQGFETASKIYKWVNPSDYNASVLCNQGNTKQGYFSLIDEVTWNAARKFSFLGVDQNNKVKLVLVSLAGSGVVAKFLDLNELVLNPNVVVKYPKVTGACSALYFDARGSGNGGGRTLKADWSFQSFTPLLQNQFSPSADLMRKIAETSSLLLDFNELLPLCAGDPSCVDNFVPPGSYTLLLTVQNWLGGKSVSTISFTKYDTFVPSIWLLTKDVISIYSDQKAYFEVSVGTSACENVTALSYSWEISPKVLAPRTDMLHLALPSNAFAAQTSYNLSFSVTSSTFVASIKFHVYTLRSPPRIVITGGNMLIAMNVAGEHRLDASNSQSAAGSSQVWFSWTCYQNVRLGPALAGPIAIDCATVTADANSQFESVLRLDKTKMLVQSSAFTALQVPTFTLGCNLDEPLNVHCDPSAFYEFQLVVCDDPNRFCAEKNAEFVSVYRTWLKTSPASVPETSVTNSAMPASNTSNILLKSQTFANVQYRWVQLSPPGSDLLKPNNILSSALSNSLVLRSGLLLDSTSYTMRVYAHSSTSNALDDVANCMSCGWAQVQFDSMSAIRGGLIQASPGFGVSAQTTFSFSTESWMTHSSFNQDDLPLSYSFYYESDGVRKYLSAGSYSPSVASSLSGGDVSTTCSQTATCRTKTIFVSASYSTEVPLVIPSVTVELSLSDLNNAKSLIESQLVTVLKYHKGALVGQFASTTCVLADFMNDNSINWEFFSVGLDYKKGVRDQLSTLLSNTVQNSLPIQPALALQLVGTLSAITGAATELSTASISSCFLSLRQITTSLIAMSREGSSIVSIKEFEDHVTFVSSQFLQARSVLLSQVRGSTGFDNAAQSKRIRSALPQSKALSTSTLLQLQDNSGLDIITSLNLLSELSVLGFTPGQVAARTSSSDFLMETSVHDAANLAGMSYTLSRAWSGCATCIYISAQLQVTFPSTLQMTGIFQIQRAMVMNNPFDVGQTQLSCINSKLQSLWSSALVYLPADNAGNLYQDRVRKDVMKYGFDSCEILSPVYVINVRPDPTSTYLDSVVSDSPLEFVLSFDPKKNLEVSSGVSDPFTGVSSTASCVRFDTATGKWSTNDIEHIEANFGFENGTGAYVKCRSKKLGIFAVSEV